MIDERDNCLKEDPQKQLAIREQLSQHPNKKTSRKCEHLRLELMIDENTCPVSVRQHWGGIFTLPEAFESKNKRLDNNPYKSVQICFVRFLHCKHARSDYDHSTNHSREYRCQSSQTRMLRA